MKTYTVRIDKKYVVWENILFSVKAKNKKELKELLNQHNGIPPAVSFQDEESGYIHAFSEPLTLANNGGKPVFDIISITEDNS